MWLHVPELLPEVTDEDLTLLSLCAGGGMLDVGAALALETLTGRRVVCVGYCEREAGAAAGLVARMADAGLDSAPVWDDLGTLPCELWRDCVAVVSAGIPCQPWSTAGKKLGIRDPRWLWPLVKRAVRGVGAGVLVLENVPGFLVPSNGPEAGWVYPAGLQFVLGDLAEMGWDAEWVCVSAEQVGARHRRWRVFLVACDNAVRPRHGGPPDSIRSRREAAHDAGGHRADAEGIAGRVQLQPRGSFRQNADSPRSRRNRPDAKNKTANERRRKRRKAKAGAESRSERCSKTGPVSGREGHEERARLGRDAQEERATAERARRAGPRPVPVDDSGLPFFGLPPQECQAWQTGWLIEPAVESGLRVSVHGMALVVDEARDTQLRTSGNGVVALQAAVAVHAAGRRLGIG